MWMHVPCLLCLLSKGAQWQVMRLATAASQLFLALQSSVLLSNPDKHHGAQLRGKVQTIPLDFLILPIS